ncbi:MAG: UTP--glucose-1-phosphate uridylyltransferase, partial [Dehalococcoidia bacterium]
EAVDGRPFLLMLPDVVFPGEPPGRALAAARARLGGSVISVSPVPRAAFDRYGLVDGEEAEPGVTRLRGISEKPGPDYPKDVAPGINGRYVLQPGIFDAIEEVQRRGITVKGETNLTDAMVLLAEQEPFFALDYPGPQIDSGHPAGYLVASVATALARADVSAEVRAELRALLDA